MDCIFCKIAAKEFSSKVLYEDDELFVFYDIDPKAPVHFLVIPKAHIQSVSEIKDENSSLVGKIFVLIAKLAKELGLEEGYRVVTNVGENEIGRAHV